METDSRLIPILREGVSVVKMVFFKELKFYLSVKHPQKDLFYIQKLTGAIINEVFGSPQVEEPYASFARQHQDEINAELNLIGDRFINLRIPLTDALRVQFLCDSLEGIDSDAVLIRARKLGILLMDREIPFPKNFLNLVKKIGAAYNFLQPRGPEEGFC